MIAILIIGILLLAFGLYPIVRLLLFSSYCKVAIDQIDVSVEQRQESRLYVFVDVYWIKISYQYVVNGASYTSCRVGISDGLKFQSREKAEKFSKKIKAINECFYSTKNPSSAYLIKSVSVGQSDSTYALIAAGLLFISISIVLSIYI